MGRFLAGVASALLLMTAGIFIWRAQAEQAATTVTFPAATLVAGSPPMSAVDLADPPAATERTREEKRFARYDRDKNGAVGRAEYLLSRQKAFAKLDTNGDGRLQFEEYVVKTSAKFVTADRNRNGALDAPEFATTRVVRKAKPKQDCPPTLRAPQADEAEDS